MDFNTRIFLQQRNQVSIHGKTRVTRKRDKLKTTFCHKTYNDFDIINALLNINFMVDAFYTPVLVCKSRKLVKLIHFY